MISVIDDIYSTYVDDKPRTYLGASSVGYALECKRRAFLSFRYAAHEAFDGRMLRLFDTGHRQEARILQDLQNAGYDVRGAAEGSGQLAVQAFNGLFRGHTDGVIRKGDDQDWLLFECKTASKARFADFKPKKKTPEIQPLLIDVKPVHYCQTQVYLGLVRQAWKTFGIPGKPPSAALYLMLCKDDERIHTEIVPFDPAFFEELGVIVRDILTRTEPPAAPFKTPNHKACTYCPHTHICWDSHAPDKTCGTCAHFSVDIVAGGFVCGLNTSWGAPIDVKPNLSCNKYEMHNVYSAEEKVSFWL